MWCKRKFIFKQKSKLLPNKDNFAIFDSSNVKAKNVNKIAVNACRQKGKLFYIKSFFLKYFFCQGKSNNLIIILFENYRKAEFGIATLLKWGACLGGFINSEWFLPNKLNNLDSKSNIKIKSNAITRSASNTTVKNKRQENNNNNIILKPVYVMENYFLKI